MAGPTFFCRYCWREVREDAERCPACGRACRERLPYRVGLELALRSPEELTARRAAFLLGELGDPASIAPLSRALDEGDPYVAAEAATALARIGTPAAMERVAAARAHRWVTVRAAALAAFRRGSRGTDRRG